MDSLVIEMKFQLIDTKVQFGFSLVVRIKSGWLFWK